MAEKVKLTRVAHFSEDKDKKPLINKNGKPYKRCLIDLADGRKASGFGNATTANWSEGMEVEIELTQNGQYWNFSTPKKEEGGFTEQDRTMLREIHQYISAKKESVADEGLQPKDSPF